MAKATADKQTEQTALQISVSVIVEDIVLGNSSVQLLATAMCVCLSHSLLNNMQYVFHSTISLYQIRINVK